MSKTTARSVLVGLALAVLTLLPESLSGQAPAVTVAAGPAPYDLAGTGTAFTAAVRVDVPVTGFLVVEPGLGFLRYKAPFDDATAYVLPELSLQARYPRPSSALTSAAEQGSPPL